MSTQLSERSQIVGRSAAGLSASDRGRAQARERMRRKFDAPTDDGATRKIAYTNSPTPGAIGWNDNRKEASFGQGWNVHLKYPSSSRVTTVPPAHAIEDFPVPTLYCAHSARTKDSSRSDFWPEPRGEAGFRQPAGIVFVNRQRAVTAKSDERLSCPRKP
jgi:hypothetical protein